MNVAHRALLPCLLALSFSGMCSAPKRATPAAAASGSNEVLAHFVYLLPAMHSAPQDKIVAAAQSVYPSSTKVSFTPIDSRHVLVAFPTTVSEADLRKLLDEIASSPDAEAAPPENFVSHLLYNRDAKDIAAALADTFPGLSAKDLGDDTILLSSVVSDNSNQEQVERQKTEIKEAQRLIALADFPRPSVSITAWNLRISASDEHDAQGRRAKESIESQAKIIGNLASTHNLIVQNAIDRGWQYLAEQVGHPEACPDKQTTEKRAQEKQPFLDKTFYQYLAAAPSKDKTCAGLGYRGLFNPLPPDLTQMLLAVIAAADPTQAANDVLDRMEGSLDQGTPFQAAALETGNKRKASPKSEARRFADAYAIGLTANGAAKGVGQVSDRVANANQATGVCEGADYAAYARDQTVSYLKLNCVRQTLAVLLRNNTGQGASKLGELRSLIADFLFQYKASVLYPHTMSPFHFTAAAHNLDAGLAPIMDAFTRDIEVFQTKLQEEIVANPLDHHVAFSAGSIVTVRTLSDNEAKVAMQTQNFFDATNPPTLKQFADALATAEKDQPKILTGNLSADAVTGALAALTVATQPKATAKLGDGVSLTVTPHSLYGAAGMELNLTLNADETTDSSGGTTAGIVTEGSSTTDPELTSRVAKHDVTTLVRLESLKLTEISTVASELVRAKRPLPVILPFLEFPVIGGLVQIPRAPSHVYHRSFAIVSAMEVPTAADLASTIPFSSDIGGMTDGAAATGATAGEPTAAEKLDAWNALASGHAKRLNCFAFPGSC